MFEVKFLFDDDKVGTKTYDGDIIAAITKFNADCDNGVLPQVNNIILVKNVTLAKTKF